MKPVDDVKRQHVSEDADTCRGKERQHAGVASAVTMAVAVAVVMAVACRVWVGGAQTPVVEKSSTAASISCWGASRSPSPTMLQALLMPTARASRAGRAKTCKSGALPADDRRARKVGHHMDPLDLKPSAEAPSPKTQRSPSSESTANGAGLRPLHPHAIHIRVRGRLAPAKPVLLSPAIRVLLL